MIITLIRHTSVDVPQGTCYGQTDVPLKDSFPEEAAITKSKIARQKFDVVYTSPLSRCVKLADYCGYTNAIRDNRIMELNFGEWEMQHFDNITDPRLQEWFDDYINIPAAGGESFRIQLERVSAFLDELKEKDYSQVAVFAHGGVLVCAQVYAGILKVEEAFTALTPYGGIVRIEI
jgi:alpha-ribazole phosphatase